MVQKVAFWAIIAVLLFAVLVMVWPMFEMVGLAAMMAAYAIPHLREAPWWGLPVLILFLAMITIPPVLVGRILIQAYRHTRQN